MRLYVDCETIGLCGGIKLIQFAEEEGPVRFIPLMHGWEGNEIQRFNLHSLWSSLNDPDTTFIGFNTAFDLFHLYRTFHRLEGYAYDSPERPIQPFACKVCDLQTHAIRKSPLAPFAFSKGASRSVAAVRRIPRVAADVVRSHVEHHLQPLIPSVCALKCSEHEVSGQKDLVTLSWSVDGRLSLKNLMQVYGLPTLKLAEVWPLPEKGSEKPWLPYPDPEVHDPLEPVCDMILSDRTLPFWSYAALDIHYLRVLEERLGHPEPDHHDTCTHIVAYTRYAGMDLDRPTLVRTQAAYAAKIAEAQKTLEGIDLASPKQRLALLKKYDPLIGSSKKAVIESLAKSDRPCAKAAQAMMDFGMYTQRLNQVEKVLECRTGKAHIDMRVMGTRTGRMAGSAGLNWQGIPKVSKKSDVGIRAALKTVAVGDWAAFEVVISAAVFPDAMIQSDLDNGIDPHSMNAVLMQPAVVAKKLDYEQFLKLVKDKDPWATSIRSGTKALSFGLAYFCSAAKVAEILGVSMEQAEKMLQRYYDRFKGFAEYRRRTEKATQTADTERWSKDSVSRMSDEITDWSGYRISWSFEKAVACSLWALGGEGIRTGLDGTVLRNKEKGRQSIDQSIRSALLGGAIAIQAAVSRQMGNAPIQSLGSNLTKILMARIWDRHRMPMGNCHDEAFFPAHPNFDFDKVQACVDELIAEWKPRIPSLRFDFARTSRWSDK